MAKARDEVYVDILTETKKSVASMAKLAAGITAAVLVINKINAKVKEMTAAYLTQVKAETKLQSALRATGNQVGYTSGELTSMASEMSRATGIADEMIIGAQSLMTTFTQIGHDVFPQAIDAAADMSAMFGQDLQQSVIQLGTALNDPIAGVGRLRRIGISFTESQKQSIEAFIEQNDLMSAQKVILDELRVEFGGVAKEVGETAVGSMEKYKNALVDLKEEGGRAIDNFFRPLRDRVTEIINRYVEAKQKTREFLDEIKNSGVDEETLFGLSPVAFSRLKQNLKETIDAYVSWQEGESGYSAQARAIREIADSYGANIALIYQIAESEGYVTEELLKQETSIGRAVEYQQIGQKYAELLQKREEERARIAKEEEDRLEEISKWVNLRLEAEQQMEAAIQANAAKARFLGDEFDEAKENAEALKSILIDMAEQGFETVDLETNAGGLSKIINKYKEYYDLLMQTPEPLKKVVDLVHDTSTEFDGLTPEIYAASGGMDELSGDDGSLERLWNWLVKVKQELKETTDVTVTYSDSVGAVVVGAINTLSTTLAEQARIASLLTGDWETYGDMVRRNIEIQKEMQDNLLITADGVDYASQNLKKTTEELSSFDQTMASLYTSGYETFFMAIGSAMSGVDDSAKTAEEAIKGFVATSLRAFGQYLLTAEAVAAVSTMFGNIGAAPATLIAGAGAAGAFAAAGAVEALATGGIVTRPTLAMIGERGPEAVVPLNGQNAPGGLHVHIHAGMMVTQMQATRWVASIARATR